MTWMETPHGSKAHWVPHDSMKKYALCGVQADGWNEETDSLPMCKKCKKIKERAKAGEHSEYEHHQVV